MGWDGMGSTKEQSKGQEKDFDQQSWSSQQSHLWAREEDTNEEEQL